MATAAKQKPPTKIDFTKLATNTLGGLAVLALLIFLVVIIFGDRLGLLPFIRDTGLYFDKDGIYADCSKAQNQDNVFCNRGAGRGSKSWGSISKGGGSAGAFSLSGRDN